MILQLDDIYIRQTSEKLISQVQINIDSYGIYLVCGKNGSGKTTIAKLLFEKYPQLISLMLQENDLIFPNMSILQNIEMHQGKETYILKFLKAHQLEYILEKDPKHLSGGEKRLVSLLRVLFSDKKIIILDEPSNDIDYIIFEKIYELISLFSREKAILLISHDDRFNYYIRKYEIKDKNLCLIDKKEITNKFPDSIKKIELKIIKIQNYNYMFFCCFIISLGILIYSLWNGSALKEPEPYSKYKQGIYHISSLIGTNVSEFNDIDSFNTSLLQIAFKWNKLEYFKKINDTNKRLEIGLEIDHNTIKDIYPLQFYNAQERSYTNVLDKMQEIIFTEIKRKDIEIKFQTSLKDYLNSDKIVQCKVHLPTSVREDNITAFFENYGYQVIYDNQSDHTISIEFNMKLYQAALLPMQYQDDILVEAILILKDNINFMDFIFANHLEKKAVLIQGFELYLLNIEINNFNAWYILIRSLAFYLLLIIGLFWIIINIYERANHKKYHNLYYYGFSAFDIENQRNSYFLIKYFNIFVYISYILTGFIIFYTFHSYMIILILVIYAAVYQIFMRILWKVMSQKIRRLLNDSRRFHIK